VLELLHIAPVVAIDLQSARKPSMVEPVPMNPGYGTRLNFLVQYLLELKIPYFMGESMRPDTQDSTIDNSGFFDRVPVVETTITTATTLTVSTTLPAPVKRINHFSYKKASNSIMWFPETHNYYCFSLMNERMWDDTHLLYNAEQDSTIPFLTKKQMAQERQLLKVMTDQSYFIWIRKWPQLQLAGNFRWGTDLMSFDKIIVGQVDVVYGDDFFYCPSSEGYRADINLEIAHKYQTWVESDYL